MPLYLFILAAIRKMEIPFFSIVIPTHNRATFIGKAIESVIGQIYDKWELVIVDDGSTDNTKEVILSFNDDRVIYIYQENSERSAARNNGIRNAKGKYICFLDSDDFYEKNHLKTLHKEIQKLDYPKAMFFCNVSRIENGIKNKVPTESIGDYKNPIEFILLAKESVIPSRVCIHKDILNKHAFNIKLNISEDAELFSRIVVKHKLYQIQNYGAVYTIHKDNTTHMSKNPYNGQLKSLKIIFNNQKIRSQISRKVKNKKLSSCYFGIAKFFLHSNNKIKMRYNLLKSLLLDPFSESSKHKIYLFLIGKQ
jgi:glycosyltransferase involved in cell wall biosynthesis